MKNIIIEKIFQERLALEQAWKGYYAEKDPYFEDLYLADMERAAGEIERLESLLSETVELENKLPL